MPTCNCKKGEERKLGMDRKEREGRERHDVLRREMESEREKKPSTEIG